MFTKHLDNKLLIQLYLISMRNKHGRHYYQLFLQTENIEEYRHTPKLLSAKGDNKVNWQFQTAWLSWTSN